MGLQQYESVCKEQFAIAHSKVDKCATKDQVDGLIKQMAGFHNRLFVDNGKPCVQTRLDRTERLWKVTVWIIGVICAASIAQAIRHISDDVTKERAALRSAEQVKIVRQ